jgi:hypothetical protein
MQVPPPPQADGKKILFSPKVVSKVLPLATSISFSPLMVIVTGPDGDNFCFVKSNNVTNKSVNTKKAMTVAAITPVILAAKNIYLIFYSETTN